MRTPSADNDGPRASGGALLLLFVALAAAVCLLPQPPQARASYVQTNAFISVCGNGVPDGFKVCDDGAGNNTGAYGSSTAQRHCLPDCTGYGPYCGDGVLEVRFSEQCDLAGNNGGSSLCSATCQSVPAVPPSSPPQTLGTVPYNPGATPGTISALTQTQVILRGKAFPQSQVDVLKDGSKVGTIQTDSNADFQYNTTDVTPGTVTFSFLASDPIGTPSLLTSVVFDVVASAVTNVNNILIPPTIAASARQAAPGDPLTLTGYSVPGASVASALDANTDTPLNATADGSGKWALALDTTTLSRGFHSMKSLFSLATTTRSGYGKSVNFYIGSSLPSGGTSPDLNGDGKTNLVDFSIFLLSWNTADVRSDFNQDGKVNLADFSILLFNWTG